MNSQIHDIRLGRLDSIDLAIVIMVWGTVIAYSGIIGGVAESIFRYSCVGISALVGIMKILRLKSKIPSEMIILLTFIYIAFASIIVSVGKTYTFARAVNFAMLWFFLLGVYFSMEIKSADRIVTTLAYSFVFVILLNFLVLLANVPSAWWQGRFQGIVGHPNTMGAICMATYPLLMLLRSPMSKMKPYIFTFALLTTFLLHFLTSSRASLTFSLLGLGLYFLLSTKKKRLLFLYITLWLICVVLFANYMYGGKVPLFLRSLQSHFVRRESSESLRTFTGRTMLWESSMQKILKRPLFGYGYDVEGQIFHGPEDYLFRRTFASLISRQPSLARLSLHNGYLSVLIGTGIIGFIVWLYLLYRPFRLLWKLPNNTNFANFRRSLLMMMIMGLCMNLLEYSIDGGRNCFSIAFWILWIVLVKVSRSPSSLSGRSTKI